MNDELRITEATAILEILRSQQLEIERHKGGRKFSEYAILERAAASIRAIPRSNGVHIIPLTIAPSAKSTNISFGPVKIQSYDVFQSLNERTLHPNEEEDDIDNFLRRNWSSYSSKFDHFALVSVQDHELECGHESAVNAVNIVINLIRMYFGYQQTKNIRHASDFRQEPFQSRLFIDSMNGMNLSSSSGVKGSFLEDAHFSEFSDYIKNFSNFFESLLSWVLSTGRSSPVLFDRIVYSNMLIAEAYSEPNHKFKIIRLVSALEALAVLPPGEKSNTLSKRCSLAANWDGSIDRTDIENAIMSAYSLRNAILHGDGATEDQCLSTLFRLDQFMLIIKLGFLRVFAIILRQVKPKSIKTLRKAMSNHLKDREAETPARE